MYLPPSNSRLIALLGASFFCSQPFSATTHDFCITRVEIAGPEFLRARIYFSDEDPGREAASHLLVQHYRRKGTPAVRVDEVASGACANADTQHITFTEPVVRRPEPADSGIPNVRRVANRASHALTSIAEDASRLMCRLLPC